MLAGNREFVRKNPIATKRVVRAMLRATDLCVSEPALVAQRMVDRSFTPRLDYAWVRLRWADEPPARLAITPYPAELVTHVAVGGDTVSIRPSRTEDAEAHIAFLARLSPQDLRYRFFNAIRELSREQIARLTQVDYDREMAFVATRDVQGDTIGVARLISELGGRSGEFAVVVQRTKGAGKVRR
jgi:acetyltransferase